MSSSVTIVAKGCEFLSQTPASIFTPEQFTGDEALMIRTAEQFSRNEILPLQERLEAQEEGLMPSLVRKAGDLGFCGVDSNPNHGGLGLSKNLSARILEFLSLNASFSVTIGVTSGISQVGLNLFGSPEQQAKYLPSLTSGEQIGAYALSEPNSGTDALSLSCRAEKSGDKWILNGTKMWISNAKWAEQFLVIAKVEGERISAFIVERGFPGVSISREEHKMGLKGSSTARLILENAEVPVENLLHEEGKGHHVAMNALNLGRFKLSSMSIGPAREALTVAAKYAQERRQFGKSIAEFGLIQKKMADMAAWYFIAESMVYRTGALIDSTFELSDHTPAGNRAAAEEFAIECSACKVMSTELEALVVDEALQVFGGYGFTEEFPVARLYRDARISRIYEGTNEINRAFLADRFLRRVAEGKASAVAAGDSTVSQITGRAISGLIADYGAAEVVKYLHQAQLGALSDLIMLTYAEQSIRLRAAQTGGINSQLAAYASAFLSQRAASAYQTLTAESVVIPAVSADWSWEAISTEVYAGRLPSVT